MNIVSLKNEETASEIIANKIKKDKELWNLSEEDKRILCKATGKDKDLEIGKKEQNRKEYNFLQFKRN